jgi:tryptophan synthase alpha chain
MKKYNGFYLMANYPDRDTFIKAAQKGFERFDFLEIGIPFSDPIADGEVIANAAQSLIDRNCSFSEIIESIKILRMQIPVDKDLYIMTYANIIYNMDMPSFNKFCLENRIRGLIIPDVPYCERNFFRPMGLDNRIKLTNFMTPESTTESIREIAENSDNFIYFVSMRGITGTDFSLDDETKEKIRLSKSIAKVPVVTGFGIKTADAASKALEHSDGFIVGTALIEALNKGGYDSYCRLVDSLFI